jgi:hypothetical protein
MGILETIEPDEIDENLRESLQNLSARLEEILEGGEE